MLSIQFKIKNQIFKLKIKIFFSINILRLKLIIMGANRSKVWYDENQRKILILSFSEEYSNGNKFLNFIQSKLLYQNSKFFLIPNFLNLKLKLLANS